MWLSYLHLQNGAVCISSPLSPEQKLLKTSNLGELFAHHVCNWQPHFWQKGKLSKSHGSSEFQIDEAVSLEEVNFWDDDISVTMWFSYYIYTTKPMLGM